MEYWEKFVFGFLPKLNALFFPKENWEFFASQFGLPARDDDLIVFFQGNADFAYDMTHDEKKERVARSVGYLKYQKELTDWTSEDFTVIDKAIADADKFTG